MASFDIQKGQAAVQRLTELGKPKSRVYLITSLGSGGKFPKLSKEFISGLEGADLRHEERNFVPNLCIFWSGEEPLLENGNVIFVPNGSVQLTLFGP